MVSLMQRKLFHAGIYINCFVKEDALQVPNYLCTVLESDVFSETENALIDPRSLVVMEYTTPIDALIAIGCDELTAKSPYYADKIVITYVPGLNILLFEEFKPNGRLDPRNVYKMEAISEFTIVVSIWQSALNYARSICDLPIVDTEVQQIKMTTEMKDFITTITIEDEE